MKLRWYNNLCVFLALMFGPLMVIGQECNESMVVDTPNERFEDQQNGTVLDKNTQLVWKKCAEGQAYNNNTGSCDGEARMFVSNEALAFVENINNTGFAGHTDWRVPNMKELQSIIESSCVNPAINVTVFRNTPSGYFRTSTPSVYSFYCINFGNGRISNECDNSGVDGGGMGGMGGLPDISQGYLRFVRN